MTGSGQRLLSSNVSPDIADALGAPVADPLWMLARQWQMGEFEAETGGSLVQVHVTTRSLAVDGLRMGALQRPLTPETPLEAAVEAEDPDGSAPAWDPQALCYRFALQAGGATLVAGQYDGRALDWHDFDLVQDPGDAWAAARPEAQSAAPGRLHFPGAPLTRWWTIEAGDAHFDSAIDPEPNVLSMLLPEFFYTDMRNWHVVPAPARAGTLRRIDRVEVVDSFGVVTEIGPAADLPGGARFALFALDVRQGGGADGRVLFTPAIAGQVLDCDLCEEVRFTRDEGANLVWAHECTIEGPDGTGISTRPEVTPDTLTADGPGRYFTLMTDTPRAFIPYVPRQTAENPAVEGDVALRRGRTQPGRDAADPQHRSRVVAEATWISQETVPPAGLRVRRLHRFARGADGTGHAWVGRDRDLSDRGARPGLRFDTLREETGEG